jgi:uncharacterized membrane protein YphA (DoxX/SURF4 family)
MNIATYVFALAAIATGIIDLVWGTLDPAHQPIQAFGDRVPGQQAIAYVIGAMLVTGGAAILVAPFRRFGAIVLAVVYCIVAIFWLPRFYTAPLVLGVHPSVYVGVLGGVCAQAIVVCAALIVYASATTPGAGTPLFTTAVRWIFGLSSIVFGLNHFNAVASNTTFVPTWLPFGQAFWVEFTGTAFVLAGVAIVSGILDVLSARLLALMLFVFSVVTLLPRLVAGPPDEGTWGGNAYEIVAVASAWILAEWLAARASRTARSISPRRSGR